MGDSTHGVIERHRIALVTVGVACVALAVIALTIGAGGIAGSSGALHSSSRLVDPAGMSVGSAKLVEDRDGRVHVNVHVKGMSPGHHGIHVHNTASCASTSTAFSGAGSHHNPGGVAHGSHAGDLPNLTVNTAGVGHLNARIDRFTLSAGPHSALDADGSALVIHAAADDLITDPTGNSGARIACGVLVAD